MISFIKKLFHILMKNIDKAMALIIFICTLSGAWFLFNYANSHGVSFIDLIKTDLIISYGALSLFTLAIISYVLSFAVFISPKITLYFYKKALMKSRVNDKRKRIKIYITYSLAMSILNGVLYQQWKIGIGLYLIGFMTVSYITVQRHTFLNYLKQLGIVSFNTLTYLIMTYVIFLLFSRLLNFTLEPGNSVNSAIKILVLIVLPLIFSMSGLSSLKTKKKDTKTTLYFYLVLLFFVITYLSTAFSSSISENVTRMIGLGFQTRCYYTEDLKKYKIPNNMATKLDNNRTQLFIIADIDGKIYISQNKEHSAEFLFTAKDLTQINCKK